MGLIHNHCGAFENSLSGNWKAKRQNLPTNSRYRPGSYHPHHQEPISSYTSQTHVLIESVNAVLEKYGLSGLFTFLAHWSSYSTNTDRPSQSCDFLAC